MQPAPRLNLFQRMMLRWRDLHPYNPVHVIRIPATLERARLQDAVVARLHAAGLHGLALDAHGALAWRDDAPAPALALRPPLPTPQQALQAAIEQAFNQPFVPGEPPWRFFVIEADAGFHLGLAYDHFIAGGDAIAALLTDIALDYLGADEPRAEAALACLPRRARTYRHLLLQHPRWAWHALMTLPRVAAGGRHVSRVPQARLADPHNGFHGVSLGLAQTRALRRTAQAWGVTFNDLLLAALLQLLSPQATARRQHAYRRQLAVASIINIRHDFAEPAATWPAPCLASLRVQHAVPEGIGLQQLAQDVHAVTAVTKREHLYLQSLLGLGVSAAVWPWLAPRHRQRWFDKHHPLWAGLTNLNLDAAWQARDDAATAGLDYLRAVPTGPLCPLVLAATTVHDTLQLGIAYRRSAYSRAEVAELADELQRCLGALDTEKTT